MKVFGPNHAGSPAALILIVAASTLVLSVCAGQSRETSAVQLRFPEDDGGCSGLPDCRSVVGSAARAYVKVVIAAGASARGERGYEPDTGVVSGASGIIVHPAGYAVTAAHIAKSTALEARVTTFSGREYAARIVHVDAGREMALLEIPGRERRFPAIEGVAGVRKDQAVFAIGTPDNRPGSVAVGRVVQPRLERGIGYGDFGFQGAMALSLPIAPGHSGGPVFDARGYLVGMVVAFDLRGDGSGRHVPTGTAYAVPARAVMGFFRRHAP